MRATQLSALILVLVPAVAGAQSSAAWPSVATADPLRAAFPTLDPAAATPLAAGEWRVTVETAYFNLWGVADGLIAVRAASDLHREPVTAEQLREAETYFPDDRLWLVDLEGIRTQVTVARGLGRGWTLAVAVPWQQVGAPGWDAIAEEWHDLMSLPNAHRDRFPRGASQVYLRGKGPTVERLDLEGRALGDTTLSLSASLGQWLGAEQRAVVAVQAPTGDDARLSGSDGWDVAAQWLAAWRGERFGALVGVGLTRNAGRFLGVDPIDGWQVLAGADARLWGNVEATYTVQLERSPLERLDAGDATEPALFMRYGIAGRLPGGARVAFDLGQDWPGLGIAPDYSFHLSYSVGL